jgi:putative transport protein
VVVGVNENIQKFAEFAGHKAKALDETDIVSIAIGVAFGLVLGMIPIALPNTAGFALGLSGGPLAAGLILGHFGRIGSVRGHIPQAARLMMMELGLVLFLAGAGIKAGGRLLEILSAHGPYLLIMSLVVVLVPMIIGFAFARKVLKLDILQVLGGTCGGMTSTPGLGVLSGKVDSEVPSVSYAAAYPVALILMTVFAQVIVKFVTG